MPPALPNHSPARWWKSIWIPAGIAALLILIWSAVLIQIPIQLDYTDTYVPVLWATGKFTAVSGSIQSIILPSVQSGLVWVLQQATEIGADPKVMQVVVTHLAMYFGFIGIFVIGTTLSGSGWAGLLGVLMLPSAWLLKPWLGYGLSFWEQNPGIGLMTAAMGAAVWATWLATNPDGRYWIVPFVLLGLLFDLHPTNGLVIALSFGLAAPFIVRASSLPRSQMIWRLIAGCGVAFLFALPQILYIGGRLASDRAEGFDAADWWALMAFRKAHHVLFWNGETLRALAILIACYVLLAAALVRFVSAQKMAKLIGLFLAGMMLALVSYISIEVWPTPALAGPVLSRGLDFLVIASIGMSAALCIQATRQITDGRFAALYLLPASLIPLAITLPRNQYGPAFALGLFTYLGLMVRLGSPDGSTLLAKRLRVVAVSLIAIVVGAVTLAATEKTVRATLNQLHASQPDRATRDLAEWIQRNTPEDALFLYPPYPWITAASRRSNILDQFHMGWSVYVHKGLSFEIDALRRIYGIDIAQKSPGEVFEMTKARGTFPCMLEKGYRDLLSEPSRLSDLKDNYPNLRYVVSIQKGRKPFYWSCLNFDAAPLDFPVIYENSDFRVYDLGPTH